MRFAAVVALTVLSSITAAAQDRTLIGSNARHGGYGGPIVKVTRFAGKDVVFMGGRGGFLVNGTYAFGGGGSAWGDERVAGSDGLAYKVSVGYGGIDIEYINRTHGLVHPTFLLSLGGGGVSQSPVAAGVEQSDSFLFAEPSLHLELNVSTRFRIAVGAAYRLVNGLELPAFSKDDLQGMSAVLTFKFGKFNEP